MQKVPDWTLSGQFCSEHGGQLAGHGWQHMSCVASLAAFSSGDCQLLQMQVCNPAMVPGLQVYQPSLDQVEALPLGREQDVTVLGIAFDSQAQVSLPPLTSSSCQLLHSRHTPHITLSFSNHSVVQQEQHAAAQCHAQGQDKCRVVCSRPQEAP